MIVLNVSIKVNADKQADFEATFAKLATATRDNEPGVIAYQLAKVRGAEADYRIVEIYRDQAALDSHMQSEWFTSIGPSLFGFFAEKPVLETCDVVC